MATFLPNPNHKSEPWIEHPIAEGASFRIWHVIFFCFAGLVITVVLVCCCFKIRIPRTKQEIDADYQRKKIARKFKKKLKLIENQEMDAMDLKKALEIIQEDLRNENQIIDEQLQLCSRRNYNAKKEIKTPKADHGPSMQAEPQQPSSYASTSKATTVINTNITATSSPQ